jgi:uncharacterized peroxidase-related enzyme
MLTNTPIEPMFLPGVEAAPQPSPYLDAINAANAAGAEVWQIWNLLAFHPETAKHLVNLSQTVMAEPGPLSPTLRELIAAYTSSLNSCTFCMRAHAEVAGHLYGDAEFVWSILDDLEGSRLEEKEKALLRFVHKVTLTFSSITAADTACLRDHGWEDGAIFSAITVSALFNFYNRWVSSSGVHPVPIETTRRYAKRMADHGYVRK